MSAAATETVRYFLACRIAGCKGRSVVEHRRLDSVSRMDAIECPECSTRYMTPRRLSGKVNAEKACDGRCEVAKGPNCECACGGERHGIAHCG